MFVYLITNTINGKRYVGQTTLSLEQRWWRHCHKSSNCHHLSSAIRKYGKENFIIESIIEPPTIELMNEFEAEYIEKYCTLAPNGYNLTTGGRTPRMNRESIEKRSAAQRGVSRITWMSFPENWTEEKRRQVSRRMKGNKINVGRVTSEETKEKLRIAGFKRVQSQETKNKIRNARLGKKIIVLSDGSRKYSA
jgi:group I intron endonuclease